MKDNSLLNSKFFTLNYKELRKLNLSTLDFNELTLNDLLFLKKNKYERYRNKIRNISLIALFILGLYVYLFYQENHSLDFFSADVLGGVIIMCMSLIFLILIQISDRKELNILEREIRKRKYKLPS